MYLASVWLHLSSRDVETYDIMTQQAYDTATLLDWIENRLPADEAASVAAWAAQADEAGQVQLAWLRAFVRQSEKTILTAPSEVARQNVLRSFEQFARERRAPSIVQRLMATLLPSSASRPALSGVRGAASQTQDRQLRFTTEMADALVNIAPRVRDRQFDLSGQVMPTSDALGLSLTVQLLQDDAEYGITTTDTLGEFAFDAIPAGEYNIVISDGQVELDVRPVTLR